MSFKSGKSRKSVISRGLSKRDKTDIIKDDGEFFSSDCNSADFDENEGEGNKNKKKGKQADGEESDLDLDMVELDGSD